MDYETGYSYSNSRIFIILLLVLIGINYMYHPIDKIFALKTIINESENNTRIITIYQNVTITVTPTPDGKTYWAGEMQSGIRKLGRWFSWIRNNVEGKKDMVGYVKVYDYRIFETVHIFQPQDYKYYELLPNDNKKYLFIFVKIYLDNVGSEDVKLWVPNEKHFIVSANGNTYQPIEWDKYLRIRELEETWNDNNDYRIQYYGVFNRYDRSLEYAKTAGMVAEPIYYVYSGESNAIDGYIIYEIPKDAKEEDLEVIANIFSFGTPAWKLKPN